MDIIKEAEQIINTPLTEQQHAALKNQILVAAMDRAFEKLVAYMKKHGVNGGTRYRVVKSITEEE